MSKSDPNPNGYILLMDKPEDIMRKFKRAVTDSDSRIIFDPQNKPGVSNLLQITLWRPARPSNRRQPSLTARATVSSSPQSARPLSSCCVRFVKRPPIC